MITKVRNFSNLNSIFRRLIAPINLIYIIVFLFQSITYSAPIVPGVCGEGYSDPACNEIIPIPIDSNNSPSCTANSSINIDSLSLREEIPIVGVPFELSYSSDRFRAGVNYRPISIGLGGWTPSIVHFYDFDKHILYFGSGGIRNTQVLTSGTNFFATNIEGSEIYYFNMYGFHEKTRDALTGAVRYTFSYDSNGRLSRIADTFNNEILFNNYSAYGLSITSSYGQITSINFDENGYIASVKNPLGETYRVTHSSNGLLTSFHKPNGQSSEVTYDANGLVSKDKGSGGDFLSLLRSFDPISNVQTVSVSTALNQTTVFNSNAPSSTSSIHSSVGPNGEESNSVNQLDGVNSGTDIFGNSYQSTQAQNPRFGWMAPYSRSVNYIVPNSNINIKVDTNRTAILSDPSDPLSLVTVFSSTILQNDSARTFSTNYSAQTGQIIATSPLNRTTVQSLNPKGQLTSIQVGPLVPVNFKFDLRDRLSQISRGDRQSSFTYDNHGNVETATDFLGRVTTYSYDDVNRLTKVTTPDNAATKMDYDLNGNLKSVTPSGRPTHLFEYNFFDLISQYLPPA